MQRQSWTGSAGVGAKDGAVDAHFDANVASVGELHDARIAFVNVTSVYLSLMTKKDKQFTPAHSLLKCTWDVYFARFDFHSHPRAEEPSGYFACRGNWAIL